MQKTAVESQNHVKMKEMILYLVGVFFYTNMTGMIGSYRSAYLVNVLHLEDNQASTFNALTGVIGFILNFFIVMYIDGRRMGKGGKFRPLAMLVAVPMGALLMLSFWTPPGLAGTAMMTYIVTIAVLWGVMCNFGGSINMVANVMTPNMKERDNILSFRSISSAVGNSAPLVIVLVIGLIWKDNEGLQYIIGAGLCGVVGIITVLLGMGAVKERVPYTAEKKNPLIGFGDILKNKYAWVIILSEFLKSFRNLATYMGPFLADGYRYGCWYACNQLPSQEIQLKGALYRERYLFNYCQHSGICGRIYLLYKSESRIADCVHRVPLPYRSAVRCIKPSSLNVPG